MQVHLNNCRWTGTEALLDLIFYTDFQCFCVIRSSVNITKWKKYKCTRSSSYNYTIMLFCWALQVINSRHTRAGIIKDRAGGLFCYINNDKVTRSNLINNDQSLKQFCKNHMILYNEAFKMLDNKKSYWTKRNAFLWHTISSE